MNDLKFNLNSIKSYKNTFISSKNYYANTSYSTYTSSYLKYCSQSDPTVAKMVKNLDLCYSGINSSYLNILSWWNNFIWNIEGIENTIKGGPQTISDSTLKSYVNTAFQCLPNLNVTGNSSFSSIDQSKLSNIFSNNLEMLKDDTDKEDNKFVDVLKMLAKNGKTVAIGGGIPGIIRGIVKLNNKWKEEEENTGADVEFDYEEYLNKLCITDVSKITATHDEMNDFIKQLVISNLNDTIFTEDQKKQILKYLNEKYLDYYNYMDDSFNTPSNIAMKIIARTAENLGYISDTDFSDDDDFLSIVDTIMATGTNWGMSGMMGIYNDLADTGAAITNAVGILSFVGTEGYKSVNNLFQFVKSKFTDQNPEYIDIDLKNDYEEITSNFFNEAAENREVNKELIDSFWNDTIIGKHIKENSIAYDTVNDVGEKVGYSLISEVFKAIGSPTASAAYDAVKSFGKSTTSATEKGATATESSIYGAISSGITFISKYLTNKVNKANFTGGTTVEDKFVNIIGHSGINSVIGALKYISTIGTNAYINKSSFSEQWSQSGGFEKFINSVETAGINSILSDALGEGFKAIGLNSKDTLLKFRDSILKNITKSFISSKVESVAKKIFDSNIEGISETVINGVISFNTCIYIASLILKAQEADDLQNNIDFESNISSDFVIDDKINHQERDSSSTNASNSKTDYGFEYSNDNFVENMDTLESKNPGKIETESKNVMNNNYINSINNEKTNDNLQDNSNLSQFTNQTTSDSKFDNINQNVEIQQKKENSKEFSNLSSSSNLGQKDKINDKPKDIENLDFTNSQKEDNYMKQNNGINQDNLKSNEIDKWKFEKTQEVELKNKTKENIFSNLNDNTNIIGRKSFSSYENSLDDNISSNYNKVR